MEFYIENDLITFSHGTGIAVITDDGREYSVK